MPIHPNRIDDFQGLSHPGEWTVWHRSKVAEEGFYPNKMDVLAQSGTDPGVDSYRKKKGVNPPY